MSDLAALKSVLERASRAPYYEGRFPSQLTEGTWKEIPLTTKADLRKAYPFGLLAVPKAELATYHESSGTSGEPTPSFFTRQDWIDVAGRFARNAIAIQKGEAVLVKTPYSMVTTAHQMHQAALLAGAFVVPADNRSSMMSYPKVLRLLQDLPVNVAWCLPTEALLWARTAEIIGQAPAQDFPGFRAFIVAGEALSVAKRQHLQTVWGGKKVFEDYGSTETGSLAGECSQGKLHLWADRVFCEVYDPKIGKTSEVGTGQLVVTPLFRQAMPLVRYLVGDHVVIESSSCRCGSTQPTVQVLGRPEEDLVVNGRTLNAKAIEEALYSLPNLYRTLFYRVDWDSEGLEIQLDGLAEQFRDAKAYLETVFKERFGVTARFIKADEKIISRRKLLEDTRFSKPKFIRPKLVKEVPCYQGLC